MNRPIYPLPTQPNLGHGLIALAKMNEWEREHLPCVSTPTGRDLYFLLARRFLLVQAVSDVHLKALLVSASDRAMRLRRRQFEQLGLITSFPSQKDARSRTLVPTQKLLEMFDAHTTAMREIFSKHFTFSPREAQ